VARVTHVSDELLVLRWEQSYSVLERLAKGGAKKALDESNVDADMVLGQ